MMGYSIKVKYFLCPMAGRSQSVLHFGTKGQNRAVVQAVGKGKCSQAAGLTALPLKKGWVIVYKSEEAALPIESLVGYPVIIHRLRQERCRHPRLLGTIRGFFIVCFLVVVFFSPHTHLPLVLLRRSVLDSNIL